MDQATPYLLSITYHAQRNQDKLQYMSQMVLAVPCMLPVCFLDRTTIPALTAFGTRLLGCVTILHSICEVRV